jgi:hypothetical protein
VRLPSIWQLLNPCRESPRLSRLGPYSAAEVDSVQQDAHTISRAAFRGFDLLLPPHHNDGRRTANHTSPVVSCPRNIQVFSIGTRIKGWIPMVGLKTSPTAAPLASAVLAMLRLDLPDLSRPLVSEVTQAQNRPSGTHPAYMHSPGPHVLSMGSMGLRGVVPQSSLFRVGCRERIEDPRNQWPCAFSR